MTARRPVQRVTNMIAPCAISVISSLDGLNTVTPVTLRLLTRCVGQGRVSTVTQ